MSFHWTIILCLGLDEQIKTQIFCFKRVKLLTFWILPSKKLLKIMKIFDCLTEAQFKLASCLDFSQVVFVLLNIVNK